MRPFNGIGRGGEDDCLDDSVMIQLRALNGTGAGGEDNRLDGSVMIQLKTLNGKGKGGEDDCLVGSVKIQLSSFKDTGGGEDDCLDCSVMKQSGAFHRTGGGGDGGGPCVSVINQREDDDVTVRFEGLELYGILLWDALQHNLGNNVVSRWALPRDWVP